MILLLLLGLKKTTPKNIL